MLMLDSRIIARSILLAAGNLTAPPKKASLLKAYTDNKVLITGRISRHHRQNLLYDLIES